MTLEYFQSSTLTVKVSVLFYLQQTRHASALTSKRNLGGFFISREGGAAE
jgi:hypothetical protein